MHQNQRHIERAAIEHFQILHLQIFENRIQRVFVRKVKKIIKISLLQKLHVGSIFPHFFSSNIIYCTHSSSSLEVKIQILQI